jgi:hypothetical protein
VSSGFEILNLGQKNKTLARELWITFLSRAARLIGRCR